jgi:hypothetical protein
LRRFINGRRALCVGPQECILNFPDYANKMSPYEALAGRWMPAKLATVLARHRFRWYDCRNSRLRERWGLSKRALVRGLSIMRLAQYFSSGFVAALAALGSVVASSPATAAAPPPIPSHCRDFTESVVLDGARQRVHGMACRRSDGSWQVVPTPVMKAPLNTPFAPVTTDTLSAPPGMANAAAYFYSPATFGQDYAYGCSARQQLGNGLGWPGFFPSANIIDRMLTITTNNFGFPFGPTVVAVAPPAFALVNPHGGTGPHHH